MLEINRVYNQDCLEGLKQIEDESIDLCVTDPPYKVISGGNKDRGTNGFPKSVLNRNDGKIFDFNDIDFKDWIPEVYRVLKKDTHFYCMTNVINLKDVIETAEKKISSPGLSLREDILLFRSVFFQHAGQVAEFPLEDLEKVGIVVKTAVHAGGQDRDAVPDHVAGGDQSFFCDVAVNRKTRVLAEAAAQVLVAYVEGLRDLLQTQVLRQASVDIFKDLIDPFIFCYIRHGQVRGLLDGPAKIG